MRKLSYHIDAYKAEHESGLLDLEHSTPQGKGVKLEMVRPEFLSRSKIFDRYDVFVALNQNRTEIIGVSAVSIVPLMIENIITDVGFGYDLKVAPPYQNRGIAKEFAKHLIDVYLADNGISEYFTTFKSSNETMTSVVHFISREWQAYNFIYLTVPTFKRVKYSNLALSDQLLSIEMLGNSEKLKKYIIETENGIKIWKTYSTYQLKIQDMTCFLNMGIKSINSFKSKTKKIPVTGDVLKFATLYHFNKSNIGSVNEALDVLQKRNIQYLNICCTKDDFVYKLFNPIAISRMPYSLLNTFGVTNGQRLSLDVRCL
ncbi:GNAT family N-acetyltransferase [Lutimonas sp.]|uniref:GNAT family N-acetyltransferase n=1 Tax=Lutimonas sp. TaxID=1872403 RepID=UPI003D9B9509